MITITLNKIRAHSPCEYGWKTLLQSKTGVGMDDEFPLADVLDSNGLDVRTRTASGRTRRDGRSRHVDLLPQ